jgi:hypothetical protein
MTGGELWAATPVGLVIFAVAVAVPLHQRHQMAQRHRAHELLEAFAKESQWTNE